MANRVIHSMQALIITKSGDGRYVVSPEDSPVIELIPIEKFSRCKFPAGLLDENGLLRDGVLIECVRVSNGWVYPNHKIYPPIDKRL